MSKLLELASMEKQPFKPIQAIALLRISIIRKIS